MMKLIRYDGSFDWWISEIHGNTKNGQKNKKTKKKKISHFCPKSITMGSNFSQFRPLTSKLTFFLSTPFLRDQNTTMIHFQQKVEFFAKSRHDLFPAMFTPYTIPGLVIRCVFISSRFQPRYCQFIPFFWNFVKKVHTISTLPVT